MTDNIEYNPFNPTEGSKVYTPAPGSVGAAKAKRRLDQQAARWTAETEQELSTLEKLEEMGRPNLGTRIGYLRAMRDTAEKLGRATTTADPEVEELDRLNQLPEPFITPATRLRMGHLAQSIENRKYA